MNKIFQALDLITRAHHGQLRQNDVPYTVHLIEVASLVHQFGFQNEDDILIALLHDVVEDTMVSLKDIEEEFGASVAKAVQLLTLSDLAQKNFDVKLGEQIGCMRNCNDDVVRAVKIADKISNVRSLADEPPNWSTGTIIKYANNSELVVHSALDCAQNKAKLQPMVDNFINQYNRVMEKYGKGKHDGHL